MNAADISRYASTLEAAPLPPMVIFDLTNTCNLQCIHCPQPSLQARSDFKSKRLSPNLMERIAREVGAYDTDILFRFAGDGEPFLHAELFDLISIAKTHAPRAKLNITTNGLLISESKAKRLIDLGVDLIDISLDALTKPVYDTVRKGGDYQRLMNNIFHLLELRLTQRSPMKLMVSFVEQAENTHEVAQFRSFWEPLVDFVMVRQLHSAIGLVKTAESTARNKAGEVERFPCPHLWKRLTVDFEGRIKFCAHDWVYHEAVSLGNADEITLHEAWTGEKMTFLRNRHRSGDHDGSMLCDRCTDWASSRWDFGYERLVDKVVYGTPTLAPYLPPLP